MYIIKNALENLVRNKGRNILISAIILAIIVTTVIALIIDNTSNAIINDYKGRFGSQVSIAPDMEKVREQAMSNSKNGMVLMTAPTISPELLLSFTKSDTLQKSVANGFISGNDDAIRAIDQDDGSDSSSGGMGGLSVRVPGGNGNFRIYGDNWQDFTDGNRALLDDGKSAFPQNDNECLVSKDLADANKINVGDTLTITSQMQVDIPEDMNLDGKNDGDKATINDTEYTLSARPDGKFLANRDVTYDLKVTGIYDDLTDQYPNESMPQMAGLNRRNEILTTLNTLLSLRKTDENNIKLNVTYYLKSPDLLPEFESYVRSAGLSDMFVVSTDAASYESVVKPVLGLKNISITFMIIVLVLGAIILILLTSIAIRERKYEIGVLRAMGMKKGKVLFGLWTELLAITCICLIIGIGFGTLAAQPVTNVLLSQQVQAIESQDDSANAQGGMMRLSGGGAMLGGNVSNAEPLSEMQISIDMDTILEIIGIALLLSIVAGLFSTMKITKYEPIKILMERN